MKNDWVPRLDSPSHYRQRILPHCRLRVGEIWEDPLGVHRIGCLDAAEPADMRRLLAGKKADLAIQDPPYNIPVGRRNTAALGKITLAEYIAWCGRWLENCMAILKKNASLYVWLGADQGDSFQPLPDFMLLMRGFSEWRARSLITLRKQRGYGTQKNWMAVRQELLYYVRGDPPFQVAAEYTEIPKTLRGYYKEVKGRRTENAERGKARTIRAGNVWTDVQQVFYRLEENVPGCYAQKPLKAIERIVAASSRKGDLLVDFFSHSGSALLAAEKLGRRCYAADIDPVFAEITIRRLERFRTIGRSGWQRATPFPEVAFPQQ